MILVTGGCSFSECISPWIDTWPKQLEKILKPEISFHEGLGCQGNGMISREIIHRLSSILKTYDPQNLLVGIMWSGTNRHEFFVEYDELSEPIKYGMTIPGKFGESTGVFNPYNWVKESTKSGWLIANSHIDADNRSKVWNKFLHNWVQSQILTTEHILRVQWFLKLHGIKYFMSTYTGEVFGKCKDDINVKYLHDQIDFTQFLPVIGEYEWCRDYSNLEFPIKGDQHPSSEQHKLFAEQVIVPFLQSKNYI